MKEIFQYLDYFVQSLKNRGVIFTFKLLWNEWKWERYLKIKTLKIENLDTLNLGEIKNSSVFHHYQGASYFILNKTLGQIPKEYKSGRFIDLGCGKGRVLIMAYINGFRSLSGVDLASELLDQSRINIDACRNKFPEIHADLIQEDAGKYYFPSDTSVVFLFNPFGEEVMKNVIQNLLHFQKEFKQSPLVIYVNPKFEELWLANGFKKIYELRSKKYNEAILLKKTTE